MARLPSVTDLMSIIKDHSRRLRKLETAPRLSAASVGEGGLRFYDGGSATFENGGGITIKDGAAWRVEGTGRGEFASGGSLLFRDHQGREYAYVGGMSTNGFGMFLTRINGSQALLFVDDDPENETVQRIRLQDLNGLPLVSEDPGGGGLLSWPLVPFTTYCDDYTKWGAVTDAAFKSIAGARQYKHSPRLQVQVRHTTDAGDTTGEIRVMVNGAQMGATQPVGFVINTTSFGPATIPASVEWGQVVEVVVEARRTAGTGAVRAEIVLCAFRES